LIERGSLKILVGGVSKLRGQSAVEGFKDRRMLAALERLSLRAANNADRSGRTA